MASRKHEKETRRLAMSTRQELSLQILFVSFLFLLIWIGTKLLYFIWGWLLAYVIPKLDSPKPWEQPRFQCGPVSAFFRQEREQLLMAYPRVIYIFDDVFDWKLADWRKRSKCPSLCVFFGGFDQHIGCPCPLVFHPIEKYLRCP